MRPERGSGGVLSALRARWWGVLLCALIPVTAVIAQRQLAEDEYQAGAQVLFRSTNLDASVLNGSSYFGQSDDPLRTAATNFELIQSPEVARRVADGLAGVLSADDIAARMSFAAIGSSDVVEVAATDTDPEVAASLANAWAREFVAYRRETDRAQVAEAIELVQADLTAAEDAGASGARVEELRASLSQLRVVQALQTGGAEFIQPATAPTAPVSSSLVILALGAGLVGLLIGGVTAVLAERGDRRLRGPEMAGEALGLPLLASVPRLRAKDARDPSALMVPEARESFHTLAVRLRFFDLDHARRVVAVVSGESGEGKTSVALGLAMAYANMGRRVILVDCDLRRGDIRLRLPIGPGPGLAEVLSGQASLQEAVRECDLDFADGGFPGSTGGDGGGNGYLAVLAAGTSPPNPIQMLSSQAMLDVLARLRESYDNVVVDTSPLLRVSDAEALLPALDGFVIVARVQSTTTDDLERLTGILSRESERALGVVANDVHRRDTRSGYYGVTAQTGVRAGDR